MNTVSQEPEEEDAMKRNISMKWLSKMLDSQPVAYYATLASLLSGAAIMIIVLARPSQHRDARGLVCVPAREIPPIGMASLMAEEEGTALARVGGFVELLDEAQGASYLPLGLHTIARDTHYGGPRFVRLVGDCVELELRYSLNNSLYHYQSLEMSVRNGAKKSNKIAKKICHFREPFEFEQPDGQRYSCKQTRSHLCVALGHNSSAGLVARANLVLSMFELELDGNATQVQHEEFQKQPLDGSCDRWLDRAAAAGGGGARDARRVGH